MKTLFYTKTLIALTVAVVATAALSPAQEPPVSPVATLPAGVLPASPLAEVVKLAQAGVDASIIKNYIASSRSAFNLNASLIISLADAGVPTDIVNAMLDHDKNLSGATATTAMPVAPANASVAESVPTTAPAPVTVNEFYNNLAPYGTWVEVEGYGRCWRPTTVIYDSAWRPYCDRGHWVYTDCGWYWDSDYSWGITFHYGRWFRHAHWGWCWLPDTVWAPSWVTWRSNDDYCGWAPLPPFTVYQPGVGFLYRGAGVAVGFDFGLSVDCFTFVGVGHFSERHPRNFLVEPHRAPEIFRQTTIINNFDVHNRVLVNCGIPVSRISTVQHRPIQPLAVGSLPNAGRQGWRGENPEPTLRRSAISPPVRNISSPEFHHEPVIRNTPSNEATPHHVAPPEANAIHSPSLSQPSPVVNRTATVVAPVRTTPAAPVVSHAEAREVPSHNAVPVETRPAVTAPTGNNATPGSAFNHNRQTADSPAGSVNRSQPLMTPRQTATTATPKYYSAPAPSSVSSSTPAQSQPRNWDRNAAMDKNQQLNH